MVTAELGTPEEYTTPPELYSEDAKRTENLLAQAEALLEKHDFSEFAKFIQAMRDDDPLVTKGDFLVQLHELGYKSTGWRDSDYYDLEESHAAYDAFALLVEKMGDNLENLSYLKRIFYEDRVPKAVLSDIDTWEDGDDYSEANYFCHVVKALGKINSDESVVEIERMLIEIIDKNDQYHKEQYESIPPERIVRREVNEDLDEYDNDYYELMGYLDQGYDIGSMYAISGGFTAGRFKAEAIGTLGDCERKSSIDTIINYIKTDKEDALFVFGPILKALEKIDINLAATKLLELARTGDAQDKRSALWLLYRLEFGRIGISEKGLKYLDKMYDLGQYNSQNFFVQRLTANGEVGVFDRANERLLKYLHLTDLPSAEKQIRTELYDLTYRDLFVDRLDLPEAERENRKRLLEEFHEKYFAFAQSEFFKETDVRLNNLTFREQAWFLEFTASADAEKKSKLVEFVKKYHEAGIRAFLVMENGGSGDKVLELSEKLKPKEARQVYEAYRAVTTEAEIALRTIREVTKNLKGAELFDDTLFDNLLQHAKNLLNASHEVATTGKSIFPFKGKFLDMDSQAHVLGAMRQVAADLARFNAVTTDLESFKNQGIKILDRYIFDTKNMEALKQVSLDFEIYRSDEATVKGVFDRVGVTGQKSVRSMRDLGFTIQKEIDPQKVYLFCLDRHEELTWLHHNDLQSFFRQYLGKQGKGEELPTVIVYARTGLPLYEKASYPGFLFADSEDELAQAIYTAKDIRAAGRQRLEFMKAESLTKSQEKLYDNSDLREWENKTADTLQSLKHLLTALAHTKAGSYGHAPRTILDIGTGEGRISTLLTMLGKKVIGLDISQTQLNKVTTRLEEEIEKFKRGDKSSALQQLVSQGGVVESSIITDIRQLKEHIYTIKGNFLDLERDAFLGLVDLPEKQGLEPNKFFEVSRSNQYFWNARNSFEFFEDSNFDAVTLNWHTFCEAGGIENQKQVLQNVFKMLTLGGLIYIEVPDRTIGNYAKTLTEYHTNHPDEPYGTIRDETSTEQGKANRMGEGEDTPRFFPGRDELRNLLMQVGFEDVKIDTYLITSKDDQGNEYLEVKELVITAHKPLGIPRR